jgi:hypothetical protein
MRYLLLASIVATALTPAMAQSPPSVASACANLQTAVEQIRQPTVPFLLSGTALAQAKDAMAQCNAPRAPGADPAAIQNSAHQLVTVAAPYVRTQP